MATTTTNFGWDIPQSTDLVKDGATAIAALGQDIDTAFVDLKGGTTGQVLAKASNTDLDYSWVAQDDSNAIQNSIVDAKGDLIGATANDTPARLAVGTNGQVLTADSTASTGLAWATPTPVPTSYGYSAGKNKIINGDFSIWQRGTSFAGSAGVYTADRWFYSSDLSAGGTVSRQTFTAGTAPVSGYEGQYFYRYARTSGTTTYNQLYQPIENVQTFAGQTVTISFWAKADAATTISMDGYQLFGTGGSSPASMGLSGTASLTTSWQRFSFTASVPSIAGKTIGSDSALRPMINYGTGNKVVDIWGVQIEAGSSATTFQTASGSVAGELALCQRYYWRNNATSGNTYGIFGTALGFNGTDAYGFVIPNVPMRLINSITTSNLALIDGAAGLSAVTVTLQANYTTTGIVGVKCVAASGLTANRAYNIHANNTASAFIAVDGEL
jgi:hypothetical protein